MTLRPHPGTSLGLKLLVATFPLACLVILFAAENLWIEPWLHSRVRPLPTLIPPPESTAWLVAFAVGSMICVTLIVFQILIVASKNVSWWAKCIAAAAVLCAAVVWCQWFLVTSGASSTPFAFAQRPGRAHTVLLKWNASPPPAVRYNVLRSTTRGREYQQINSSVVAEPTFTDTNVLSGVTYYYVVRAVTADGKVSVDSNEATATIP
jgi:hypothetical protein